LLDAAFEKLPLPGKELQLTELALPPNEDPERSTEEPAQMVVRFETALAEAAGFTVILTDPDNVAVQVGAVL
jgi:hypothetical protein